MKISAIVISKNEEKMIEDCLKSITWADEIVLIDSGSTDRSVDIAKKYNAKVFKTTNEKSFCEWRNLGAKSATGEWILYVDADERVTEELKKEILETINLDTSRLNSFAFAMPRRNIIFGKPFSHTGQWPDYVKRLFRKTNLKRWEKDLHEEPIFEGELGHLVSPFTHIKHETIAEMVEKTNKWSEIEGKLMFEANHPPMNVFRFFSAGFREFWTRFILQLAFLDGTEGVIYGFYQVFSRLVSYTKLWELQLTTKINKKEKSNK